MASPQVERAVENFMEKIIKETQEAFKKQEEIFRQSLNPNRFARAIDEYLSQVKPLTIAWEKLAQPEIKIPDLQAVENITDQFRRQAEFLQQSSYASAQLVEQQEQLNASIKEMEGLFTSSFMRAGDELARFCMTGQANFRQMANSIIEDLTRISITQAIAGLFGGLLGGGAGGGMGGMFGLISDVFRLAKGGVIASPALAAYSNSVVASPKLFAFARGGIPRIGIMGEAGPEAIMPLRRGPGGRLGVDASGFGERQASPVYVNVVNNMGDSADVSVRQTPAANGGVNLDVLIEQKVRGMFASGSMDNPLRGRFGLRPQLMGR